MKISKAIIALAAGLTVSGAALAQETPAAVTAEKTSGVKTIVPGAYGKVELRHTTLRFMEEDKVQNDIPAVTARPTLGTTLFDGKVDTSFTYIFKKAADTAKVTKSVMYNETSLTLLEGKYGSIGPYAYTEFDADGSGFTFSDIGINATGTQAFDVGAGSLELSAYTEPKGEIVSKKVSATGKLPVRNNTGRDEFALNDAGDTTIEQRDPTMINDSGLGVKFSPSLVKGLSAKLATDVSQSWKPKYVAKDVDGDTRTELDGYESRTLTMNRFTVAYKLTDAVTISNQTRQYLGGLYAYGIDESSSDEVYGVNMRWENRLSLTATLF